MAKRRQRLPTTMWTLCFPPLVGLVLAAVPLLEVLLDADGEGLLAAPTIPPCTPEGAVLPPIFAAAEVYWSRVWPLVLCMC